LIAVNPSLRPDGIVAKNLDGDGDIDLAVATSDPGFVSVFRNEGGTFVAAGTFATNTTNPSSIAAADFDGDGDFDVVTGDEVGRRSRA
jgi:hypothetical protein